MSKNFSLNPQVLHHAYLLPGDHTVIVPDLLAFIEQELGVSTLGNPDVLQQVHDVFGVDEARELARLAVRKPVSGERIFYLVSARSFTHEAQNALLKLLEEPIAGAHFFFMVPRTTVLLPTLLSRFFVVTPSADARGETLETSGADAVAEKFFISPPPARLKMLGKILEEKDAAQAAAFINSLEAFLFRRGDYRKNLAYKNFLKEVMRARAYVSGRSPSLKIILEHLALTAPTHTL